VPIAPVPPGLEEALRRGGGAGARMAEIDWAATPLGPMEQWTPALRATVGITLASRAQIVLFWGPELVALYNDTYAPTIGVKHPEALGRPAREGWSELWDDLGPLLRGVLDEGESFSAADRPFFIDRRGFLERVYFDVSYDPVRGEDGEVEGVICIVTETTARVLSERRLRCLRHLGSELAGLDEHAAVRRAVELLAEPDSPDTDVPWAQVHFVGRRGVRVVAHAGATPQLTQVGAGAIEDVAGDGGTEFHADEVATGLPPYAGPGAVAFPLRAGGREIGALVTGANRHLPLDEDLRAFLAGAAEHLSRAIADHRLQEEERRRARIARLAAERQREVATVLQRAILPDRLPVVDGALLAARYHPGEAGLEVGGDWYDAFEVRPGTLALAVGDVVGRGVEAAATMAQLRNGLRAYLAEGRGPAAAISGLRGMADGLGVDFCTVACVELDVASGALDVALAGHPAPLLVAGGTTAWLDGVRAAPIGVGLSVAQPEVRAHVPRGGTLVLFTDGLVERRDRSMADGLAKLARVAAGAPSEPGALLDLLLRRLGAASGDDDTAVVALQRC
jgi:serine phosphatase RsbU (regulator of sigma subunit)